jgi:transposase
VEIAPNFPAECRHVLESLGVVYYNDAMAREQVLSAEDRLRLHQQQSGPVMEQLHAWLELQFAEKKTEPNSGLGKAITYLLRHWKGLTAFLRHAGAPLDNNAANAASGICGVMPTPRLCRVARIPEIPHCFRMTADAA